MWLEVPQIQTYKNKIKQTVDWVLPVKPSNQEAALSGVQQKVLVQSLRV